MSPLHFAGTATGHRSVWFFMIRAVRMGLLVTLSFSAFFGFALDPDKLLSQFIFDRWDLEDGLPQMSVQAICQTTDGYLWLGTQEGLARFDGIAWTIFDKSKTPTLANDYINALFEDDLNRLWIATRNGVYRYEDDQLLSFAHVPEAPTGKINALVQGPDGSMWIGGEAGIYRYWDDQFTTVHRSVPQGVPPVRALLVENSGTMWIGTVKGLYRLTSPSHAEGSIRSILPDHTIGALFMRGDGPLWIGTEHGLYSYTDTSMYHYTEADGLPATQVLALHQDRHGVLWIGTAQGPVRKIQQRFLVDTRESSRKDNLTVSILEDREGSVWIGTLTDGLHRYRDGAVTCVGEPEGLPSDGVRCVIQDRQENLWIGTEEGLAKVSDRGTVVYTTADGLPNDNITCLMEAADGAIWIGTRFGGAARFDGSTWRVFDNQQGLRDNTVRTLYQDRNGRIWIGTYDGGLHVWDGNIIRTFDGRLPSQLIFCVFEDAAGALWVGTDGSGLAKVVDDQITLFTKADGLAGNTIYAIYQDRMGDLWIGTDNGLSHMRDGILRIVPIEEPSFRGVIYSILEDETGRLWISCNKGVYHVEKRAVLKLLAGHEQPRVAHYGLADGMRSPECNFGGASSGLGTRDGAMIFPTLEGLVVITPNQRTSNRLPPPVHIESIVADGMSIAPNASFTFAPGLEKLEFHYTALSYPAPSNVLFRYRLVGFEDQMVEAGGRREAYYTNLAPGRYEFKVIACNNDQVWNYRGASFSFIIQPHLYQTTWFQVAMVVMVLAMISLIYTWRVRTLVRRKRKLQSLVAQRTQALVNANRELMSTQERLVQTAHQAGMADVAVNVLHNIGNALNSVNVTSMVLDKAVQDLRIDFFNRLVVLLEDHDENLAQFLHQDERGRNVLPALRKVADALIAGQVKLVREIATLENQVLRINDIIRAQQTYTESSGKFRELTDINQLLQNILATRFAHLEDSQVYIKTYFQTLPPMDIQKSKLAQVVLHVLNNAFESVSHSNKPNKTIELRTKTVGDHAIQIDILDNGIGIDAAILDRIFFHGFTTKAESDGFGLHFCANAMREMQGTIRARSDGPDGGARFSLILPIDPTPH